MRSTPDAKPSADARVRDVEPPRHDAALESGPTPVLDASRPTDASRDATIDAHDATFDAIEEAHDAAPDCRCTADDYFVDAIVNGTEMRFSHAFPLGLYCDETEPELSHPPCGSVYRLTACSGSGGARPCLYVTVDGETPIIGDFIDATGQTFELVTGKIVVSATTGRVATGTFSATYVSRTSEAGVNAEGTFRAGATLFAPCRR